MKQNRWLLMMRCFDCNVVKFRFRAICLLVSISYQNPEETFFPDIDMNKVWSSPSSFSFRMKIEKIHGTFGVWYMQFVIIEHGMIHFVAPVSVLITPYFWKGNITMHLSQIVTYLHLSVKNCILIVTRISIL